jgi:hypothetical protein
MLSFRCPCCAAKSDCPKQALGGILVCRGCGVELRLPAARQIRGKERRLQDYLEAQYGGGPLKQRGEDRTHQREAKLQRTQDEIDKAAFNPMQMRTHARDALGRFRQAR